MSTSGIPARLQKCEFESRIFISLSIVAATCALSFTIFRDSPSLSVALGGLAGFPSRESASLGFLASALLAAAASLLRIWSGSVLTSGRMMSFKVRVDALLETGPYRIVRNPIYLADLIAFSGFALCLAPCGVILPALLFLHYTRIIRYEEASLSRQFGERYRTYEKRIPRLLPDSRSLHGVGRALGEFVISRDGLRHNALYLLFIPGFILSAATGKLLWAVALGLPAVVDWAVVHTIIGTAGNPSGKTRERAAAAIAQSSRRKVFQGVLYAQCWEDPQIDRLAFGLTRRDALFSITSGGCNVLTFLIDDPGRVIALDANPHQSHLLKLKMAALRALPHPRVLEFLGFRESPSRLETYARLRPLLDDGARRFWDGRARDLRRGVIHAGRYEGYMRLLRNVLVRLRGKQSLVRQFCEAEDAALRQKLFRERWDDWSWKLLTQIVLSRPLNVLLFDRAFYSYLDGDFSFGRHFAAKAERALVHLPVKENYFLRYILAGTEDGAGPLPPYLREENFDLIRSRLDRVEVVTDTCEHYFSTLPDSCLTRFNFSNIFEWMSPQAYKSLLRETVRVGRPGAVLTYRNLLVFRERPESLAAVIRPRPDISRPLLARDLSFIYDNYVVEEICKEMEA
jgi:S-adenosylmethionine-diacylglycerol 3-amino-3-carboxypropyl transferase